MKKNLILKYEFPFLLAIVFRIFKKNDKNLIRNSEALTSQHPNNSTTQLPNSPNFRPPPGLEPGPHRFVVHALTQSSMAAG